MIRGAEIEGKGNRLVKTLTASATIKGDYDVYLVDATAAAVTITLPDAKALQGKEFVIKKIDGSGNAVTISPASGTGQTIDGASSVSLSSQYAASVILATLNNYSLAIVAGAAFTGGTVTGATIISVANAGALVVGPNGATNPTLVVDTNTASAATGIKITGAAAAGGVAMVVVSSGTNEALTIDAKGSGGITFNTTGTGAVTMKRATVVQIASSSAFNVGVNGSTNAQFRVDTNTASAVTGLRVNGAATGNGVALVAMDSGSNTALTIDAKGTGAVGIQSTVAVAAGGNIQSSLRLSSTAGLGIYFGSGAPTVTAAQGSVYIRTDGSSISTRLYVNTDGGTTWTNVVTAA